MLLLISLAVAIILRTEPPAPEPLVSELSPEERFAFVPRRIIHDHAGWRATAIPKKFHRDFRWKIYGSLDLEHAGKSYDLPSRLVRVLNRLSREPDWLCFAGDSFVRGNSLVHDTANYLEEKHGLEFNAYLLHNLLFPIRAVFEYVIRKTKPIKLADPLYIDSSQVSNPAEVFKQPSPNLVRILDELERNDAQMKETYLRHTQNLAGTINFQWGQRYGQWPSPAKSE
jgi:hypothetical protein